MNDVCIRIEGLAKAYGNTTAVRDLSLTVERGRISGLIGPDGAGKTTAMRILCGLVRPDRGRVEVTGLDLFRERERIKHRLGYMSQTFSLYPDLTVAENLRFFADLFQVGPEDRRAREKRLMEFSGLGPFQGRRAGRLSGGMKQKLALCCALIHTPDVLVLDEPTTGVDVVSRNDFWTILGDLAREGMALLVSTPYMDEAERFDQVRLMHKGEVLAEGTPEEIRSRFPGRLLEISGPELDQARRAILPRLSPDAQLHRFGDRLHLLHRDPGLRTELAPVLRELRVDARPVDPTIEDTFVALVTQGAAGASEEASS